MSDAGQQAEEAEIYSELNLDLKDIENQRSKAQSYRPLMIVNQNEQVLGSQ